jgi:hypothetical protein
VVPDEDTREMTYEEKLEEMRRLLSDTTAIDSGDIGAADFLAALGIHPPKPKWPTDDSFYALVKREDHMTEHLRECLREAMLADPIIKAAITLTSHAPFEVTAPHVARSISELLRAVYDAGLAKETEATVWVYHR